MGRGQTAGGGGGGGGGGGDPKLLSTGDPFGAVLAAPK